MFRCKAKWNTENGCIKTRSGSRSCKLCHGFVVPCASILLPVPKVYTDLGTVCHACVWQQTLQGKVPSLKAGLHADVLPNIGALHSGREELGIPRV